MSMFGRKMHVTLPVLIASAGILAGIDSAFALDSASRDAIILQGRQADIDILNSIENRQRFQLEQRLQRELDRNMLRQREPRPEVQEFVPSCREPTTGGGNRAGRDCR